MIRGEEGGLERVLISVIRSPIKNLDDACRAIRINLVTQPWVASLPILPALQPIQDKSPILHTVLRLRKGENREKHELRRSESV
jgi:hypothetical protein